MTTVASRLIHSKASLSRLSSAIAASRNGRCSSTDSNKVDEPFKVEEAETVDVPPPPTEKLLVLGGSGFVGSHVCKEALNRGLSVASLSRSGRSSIHDSWANSVIWHQGNLLSPDSWKEALNGVTAVISCVGGFGSQSYMYKINGTANINAIRAASEKGVKRFVYISAADFGVANYLLQGYYEGKLYLVHIESRRNGVTDEVSLWRSDSQAWVYIWDSQSWKSEDTSGSNWFSFGDGSSACKTTQPASTCWPAFHSAGRCDCSGKGCGEGGN